MIEFRDYQKNIISDGVGIIKEYGFLYLAMEVRTGKTLTSLGICDLINAKKVLFITKKKAISSIKYDYNLLLPDFELEVINYESLHKIRQTGWDVVICDEAHGMGAFPKPSGRSKKVKNIIFRSNPYIILLSGTPTPEAYSQMYHQVYFIPNNPFAQYRNFYQFANDYVGVVKKKIGGMYINDYSKGSKKIIDHMSPYTINFSQKQAGFIVETTEHVLEVEMKSSTISLINKLKRDLVVEGNHEVILADTAVKLMTKVHQMCSGTIKFESGNSMVIDLSATSYWQSRDRMTTKDRLKNNIYWIFSKGGIEKDIYKAVIKKKDYTLTHFRRDFVHLS